MKAEANTYLRSVREYNIWRICILYSPNYFLLVWVQYEGWIYRKLSSERLTWNLVAVVSSPSMFELRSTEYVEIVLNISRILLSRCVKVFNFPKLSVPICFSEGELSVLSLALWKYRWYS